MADVLILVDALKSDYLTIERIFKAYQKNDVNSKIIVLGDHGMLPIVEYVDILKECASLPLRIETDYEIFLDSTMARFWFYNPDGKR